MYKLFRWYNQNRFKIWTGIIVIIFVIVMIHLLNNFIREENQEKKLDKKETTSNVVSYHNESKSIISGGEVSNQYKNSFGKLIDEFYTYCINHQPEQAYELLSSEMKELRYHTESLFKKLYYEERFQGNKQYSFQSWSNGNGIYIYIVKIFDDMLATGKSSDKYIEDYITVVSEEDEYKLNIDGYIGKERIGKRANNELLNVEVSMKERYTNYEIYTFKIKNNTYDTILLDTRKYANTICLLDERKNRFSALLYENKEEDFELYPQEAKTVKIKFNVVYRNNLKIKEIYFNDITKEGNEERESLMIEL